MNDSTRPFARCAAVSATAAILAALCGVTRVEAATVETCSGPISAAAQPTTSDCLFILQVAVGSDTCEPACACAPGGALPTTATDALRCLRAAVGLGDTLDCPCDTVARIAPDASDIVLDGVGDSYAIAVTAFDQLGGAVGGVAVEFESADPAIASVDASGSVSAGSVGTTQIILSAEDGQVTATVGVAVAEAADGTLIVSPGDLAEELILLEVPPEENSPFGARVQAVLLPAAGVPEEGDLLIMSDWSTAGIVEVIEASGSNTRVELVTSGYEGGFTALEVRRAYTLSDAVLVETSDIEPVVLDPVFGPGTSVAVEASSPMLDGPTEISTDGNITLFTLGKFKCILANTTGFDLGTIGIDLDVDVEMIEWRPLYEDVVVNGASTEFRFISDATLRVPINGVIEWTSGLRGTLKCKYSSPLSWQIPAGGGLIFAQIPTGVGFSIDLTQSETLARVDFAGDILVQLRHGVEWIDDGMGGDLEFVRDYDLDTDNLSFNVEFPAIESGVTARTRAQFNVFAFTGITGKAGIPGVVYLTKSMETFEVGARFTVDAASANNQVRDSGYRAGVTAYGFAKRKTNDPLAWLGVMQLFFRAAEFVWGGLTGTTLSELLSWEIAIPVANSPTGGITVFPLPLQVGEASALVVDMLDITFFDAQVLDSIEVRRVNGAGSAAETVPYLVATAAPGQSSFELSISASDDDLAAGSITVALFAFSPLLPNLALQITEPETFSIVGGIETEVRTSSDVRLRILDRSVFPQEAILDLRDSGDDAASLGSTAEGVVYSIEATSSGAPGSGQGSVSFDLAAGTSAETTNNFVVDADSSVRLELTGLQPGSSVSPMFTLTPTTPLDDPGTSAPWSVQLCISASANGEFGTGGTSANQEGFAEAYNAFDGWESDPDPENALAGYAGGPLTVQLGAVTVGSDGEISVEASVDIFAQARMKGDSDEPLQTLKGGWSYAITY